MVFSSTLFLFLFLPLTLILYYAIPQKFIAAKNILLLTGSLVFYSWGEPLVVLIMLACVCVNYAAGLLIEKSAANKTRAGIILFITIVLNVGMLGYYKYAGFIAENISAVFALDFELNLVLPIGISFFTFQIMSYIVDIYRGKVAAQRSLPNLALYISFFPALIAGPIVRYSDIEAQITARRYTAAGVAVGCQRFIIGLCKKVLVANQLAIFADHAFGADAPGAVMAWVGLICYALQIYFDFSGYSDMAIGLSRMFGFELCENFDYPYTADTVQVFWRKWHISLSGWFRDYLYIPLGGNRRGAVRTYINLLIVFATTGLWHGASWSFIVWGLYHGLFLMLERGAWGRLLQKLPRILRRVYTLFVVCIGWVFFRADDIPGAFDYIKSMFTPAAGGLGVTLANLNAFILAALFAGVVFAAPVLQYIKKRLFGQENHLACEGLPLLANAASWASVGGCFVLLVLSIVFITGSGFNPFLYFRF